MCSSLPSLATCPLPASPREILSFVEGNTDSPLMAVIHPGSAAEIARLGYAAISEDANFWHPELRVAELTVGDPWPGGIHVTHNPVLAGFDTHAWGWMVPASDSSGNLALVFYHADEASPSVVPSFKFRPFDTKTWQPGSEVVIDPSGSVSYGLCQGASVEKGKYSGNGYAASWRATSIGQNNVEPRLAVLNGQGGVVLGPLTMGPPEAYPGRATNVAWSSTTYLAVTSFVGCELSPVPCAPRSVIVTRVDADGSLSLASSIPALGENAPRRTVISSFQGSTWIAWSEAPLPLEGQADDAPRTVRLGRLDSNGALVAEPITLATDAHPYLSLSVHASEIGVLVAYPEIAAPELAPGDVGFGRVVVHHVSPDGDVLGAPIAIATTQFANGPHASVVNLAKPRSALVSWASRSGEKQLNVTYLARLNCANE